jgi:hypothetical protein
MNFSSYFTSLKTMEIGILILFVIYLIFDINPPESMASYIDSPIGMAAVLIITLYMFISFNPVLGVVGIFVAYEVIRRSAAVNNRGAMLNFTPSQAKKEAEFVQMNPPADQTLEEDMVNKMAPVGQSSMISYNTSEYKPVANDTRGASLAL